MPIDRRTLDEALAALPAGERAALYRRAARLRDEARRASRPRRGGERRTSGRAEEDLPPWARTLRDADLELWVRRLLESRLLAQEPHPEGEPAGAGTPRGAPDRDGFRRAIVLRTGQKLCRIRDSDGADREATLAGALQRGERSSLAVGDEVIVAGEAPAIRLLRVLPRRSALERPDPHAPGRRLVVAANIDLVVVVLAARTPPPRPRLVDRYLVAAGLGGAAALLCVNKADQLDAEGRHALGALLDPYPPLGVPVLWCSAHTGEGLVHLRASLDGRTCAFVGHSGVGKSSLINALDPALDLATGEANPFHGKGRHTTTTATLHDLGSNTRIIDTPGVRAFGLQGLRAADLAPWFPDLQALASGCAWRDCSHTGEAGCAVAEAASAGHADPRRLDSYRRILASLADADEPA